MLSKTAALFSSVWATNHSACKNHNSSPKNWKKTSCISEVSAKMWIWNQNLQNTAADLQSQT